MLLRIIGNLFIAAGALTPALGGVLDRMGIGGALYFSELLGAGLLFIAGLWIIGERWFARKAQQGIWIEIVRYFTIG